MFIFHNLLKTRTGVALVVILFMGTYATYKEHQNQNRTWANTVVSAWNACDALERDENYTKRWLAQKEKQFEARMEAFLKELDKENNIALMDIRQERRNRKRQEIADEEADDAHFKLERKINAVAWDCRENHHRKYGIDALSQATKILH